MSPEPATNARQALAALARCWKPLVVYKLATSLLSAMLLGPLALALSWRLIELSGEPVLGNYDLAQFLLSPAGWLSLALAAGVWLGLLFVEYAGLIVLAGAALRGERLSALGAAIRVLGAAPRLLSMAILQAGLAVLAVLPFAGLALLAYGLLLSDADINYFLAARPPRFWVAVTLGAGLAAGCGGVLIWLFLRWALAVPVCVAEGLSGLAALRSSARWMRGRAWRLLLTLGGWLLLQQVALAAVLAALDGTNGWLLRRFDGGLTTLLGSTAALLLLDVLLLQLVGALFAIGQAGLIAWEYQRARPAEPATASRQPAASAQQPAWQAPAWRARAVLLAVALAGPLMSISYALLLARQFVERRPTLVTAHRAGPHSVPENSLAALELSRAIGADYVEIDVQLTADGQVVLLHDRDLRRVTGDRRNLHETDLHALRQLRLRSNGQPTDQRIPTLAEFIEACGDDLRINIELKDYGHSGALPAAVAQVVRQQQFAGRVVSSSFHLPLLMEVRRLEPEIPVGKILSASQGDMTRLPTAFLSLRHRLVQGDLVRRAHRGGMEIHAWTVNERETALRLLDLGCDNLITSDPTLMRETVDWYAQLGDGERMLLRVRRWLRE